MNIQGLMWKKYSVEEMQNYVFLYSYSREPLVQKTFLFFNKRLSFNHLVVFITSLKVLTQIASFMLTW